ncbi:hypothetical protein Ahy_A06g028261 [Arachis hypogaea]|uniref:Uncharacterized protein n=1 Tax=Arachis hypogaea TaxID=3818 RepID=A0A445CQS5_ARAHY|nr:hypothetical protein Ahy_A06g028261 [Arachis hypogaea]
MTSFLKDSLWIWNLKRGSTHSLIVNLKEPLSENVWNLDRDLVSLRWKENYPRAIVSHLSDVGFDHFPLLLNSDIGLVKLKRRFRFQNN